MVLGIFRREDRRPFALYGAIVAQARQPAFYTDFGVADSLDGRFDMVVLHVVLATRRLKGSAAGEQQALFDLFLSDMDRSLREMGVGDLTVPKRMKVMAAAFYGRLEAYGAALEARDGPALADAIARNLFPDAAADTAPAALAAYAQAAEDAFTATPLEAVLEGRLAFPDPVSFAAESTP
jgi:cytochrome b pre-mRNA-processing protein 3